MAAENTHFLKEKISAWLSRYVDRRIILIIDTFISVISTLLVIGVTLLPQLHRHMQGIPGNVYLMMLFFSAVFSAFMFILVKSHQVIIRHSSLKDIGKLGVAVFGKELLLLAMLAMMSMVRLLTVAMLIADFLLTIFLLMLVRVSIVLIYNSILSRQSARSQRIPILCVGTGNKSAAIVLRLANSTHYSVKGFLTDVKENGNLELWGRKVYSFTTKDDFRRIVEQHSIEGLLFSDEKEVRDEHERLVEYALEEDMKIYVAPSIDEADQSGIVNHIREVRVEDLLGRDEIRISMDRIREFVNGKTVMVTGAAGSIGSELCRQLATFGIKKLVLFDNAETPMHNLQLFLREKFPKLDFVAVIGDVRQQMRLDFAFSKYRPQVVFHAAAYKHVPLMEENPCEAVLVNVCGSRQVADNCVRYGVEKMVMISTDKAVNPTNVMGCSKRLAEMYVQALGQSIDEGHIESNTKFVTTRFGNVLGSAGSVIPRFREQIANGGPVTVTHPDITRFFMTIPEACRLVMEAATLSTGNQIFVFDMGESVKIDTLARKMIELSGFTPDVDIKIEYTGLRSGEKLYEEVLADLEGTTPTSHDRIRIAGIRPNDYGEISDTIDKLSDMARRVDIMNMVSLMKKAVPEYISNNSIFEQLDKKDSK